MKLLVHALLDALVRPHTAEERFAVEEAHADAVAAKRQLEIYVDGAGRIVDGRLTHTFCNDRGIAAKRIVVADKDVVSTILSRNFGRHLTPDQRLKALVTAQHAVAKLPLAQRGGGKTRDFLAKLSGETWSPRSIQTAMTICKSAPEVFSRLGESLRLPDIERIAKLKPCERKVVFKSIDGGTNPVAAWRNARDAGVLKSAHALSTVAGTYDIILADPPWQYEDGAPTKRGSAERQYAPMALNDIKELGRDIDRMASPSSVLLLWATVPLLPEALSLIDAWGFAYKSQLVWHKIGALGMGGIFRICHEVLLVGVRGNVLPVSDRGISSVITEPRSSIHSQKPDVAYEVIERLWPNARRIELFARVGRKGWTQWGAEAEKTAPQLGGVA